MVLLQILSSTRCSNVYRWPKMKHQANTCRKSVPVIPGVTATVPELLRTRPQGKKVGFAPGGRISTHQWGTNASIFHGRGMEFSEARQYQPGDDVRAIDWQVTARTGRAHTKLFQEERERPVHLLVDLRSMMQFGTRVRFKSHLAAEVAAMLAWVALDGGDRLGALVLQRSGLADFRAARTRHAMLRFFETLSQETAPEDRDGVALNNSVSEVGLADAVLRLQRVCRPGSLAFVISDFNDFNSQTERELQRLSHRAHVTAIQICDPLDAMLPATGGRISDGSGAVSLSTLGRRSLQDYADAFTERRERLGTLCNRAGMVLHTLDTDSDPTQILYPVRPRRKVA